MKAFMSICCRICGDGVVDVSKVTLSKVLCTLEDK